MSTDISPRLAAFGTLCRRPSALVIPLAPIVLLVFLAAVTITGVREAIAHHRHAVPTARVDADAAEAEAAEPAATAPRFRLSPRGALGAAAAAFGGILLAASMANGTFAFLNAQQKPATNVTVSSGSLSLTVQAAGTTAGTTTAIPTAAWSNMLPGDFVGQAFTLTNTGSVATDVTARLSGTTPWDIRIIVGACPTTQSTVTPLGTTAVSYGTLSAGTSAVVCVQATLPASAAASVESTSAAFSLIMDAKQVAP